MTQRPKNPLFFHHFLTISEFIHYSHSGEIAFNSNFARYSERFCCLHIHKYEITLLLILIPQAGGLFFIKIV